MSIYSWVTRGQAMTHLPECQHVEMTEDDYEANCGFYAPPDCICPALRSCEQRVAAMRKDNGELWLDGYGTGFQDGHTFALDAAETALIEIGSTITFDMRNIPAYEERALTAIRALKEKP